MHLHENHYIKRAGVAGVRARAGGFNGAEMAASAARWRVEILKGDRSGKKESAPQNAAEAL